jgi:hypothetical protein
MKVLDQGSVEFWGSNGRDGRFIEVQPAISLTCAATLRAVQCVLEGKT